MKVKVNTVITSTGNIQIYNDIPNEGKDTSENTRVAFESAPSILALFSAIALAPII